MVTVQRTCTALSLEVIIQHGASKTLLLSTRSQSAPTNIACLSRGRHQRLAAAAASDLRFQFPVSVLQWKDTEIISLLLLSLYVRHFLVALFLQRTEKEIIDGTAVFFHFSLCV